jgi:hypothetical protein
MRLHSVLASIIPAVQKGLGWKRLHLRDFCELARQQNSIIIDWPARPRRLRSCSSVEVHRIYSSSSISNHSAEWWKNIHICFDFCQVTDKIHLTRWHHRLSGPEVCRNIQNGKQGQWQVIGDESGRIPLALEEHFPAAKLFLDEYTESE